MTKCLRSHHELTTGDLEDDDLEIWKAARGGRVQVAKEIASHLLLLLK